MVDGLVYDPLNEHIDADDGYHDNLHRTGYMLVRTSGAGLFLLVNLLVLQCRQMCGAHMAAEAYWNRNGLQVQ